MTGIIKGQQAEQKVGLVIMRTVRQMRGKRKKLNSIASRAISIGGCIVD